MSSHFGRISFKLGRETVTTGIRCEISFTFVNFSKMWSALLGRRQAVLGFSAQFQPQILGRSSEIHHERSRISAVLPGISQWWLMCAVPTGQKSSFCSLFWQPPTARILLGPEFMFLKSEHPKLKSNLKARPPPFEVRLAVRLQFRVCWCLSSSCGS